MAPAGLSYTTSLDVDWERLRGHSNDAISGFSG